jgi:hypothetical protein
MLIITDFPLTAAAKGAKFPGMKTAPAVVLAVVCFFSSLPAAGQTDVSARAAMLKRLAGPNPGPLFEAATPLLLDFVDSILPPDKRAALYEARDRGDLLLRIESACGRDLIDLGHEMFEYYESRAAKEFDPDWLSFPAGPFLMHVHPGSPADRDRALIGREIEAVMGPALQALGLAASFPTALAALKPAAPEAPGLIPIYLHSSRTEAGASKISKNSTGSATLGATIVDKAGRLTFEAHILYFNALSLPVIEHEAAHAAVMLGTFDVAALTAKPLEGEADLRKAFFAGYRKIPTFLQEGLGDWAFYYRGFHRQWGLLPEPESLLVLLRREGRTLPLAELLAGDIRYAAKNRKAYSLEAAVFLQYLLITQGSDNVGRWLASNEVNGAKTFAAAFGRPLETVEQEFLTTLKDPR